MIQLSCSAIIHVADGDQTFVKFVAAGDPLDMAEILPPDLAPYIAGPDRNPNQRQRCHQFAYFGGVKEWLG